MKPENSDHSQSAGFTLIEILVGAAILGFIAFALLPAFSSLVNNAQVNSFRLTCASIVKAKMQEYVSGVSSYTTTNVDRVVNGFQYSKYRFQNVTGSCVASPTASAPGFREKSADNTTMASTDPTESNLQVNMKGFQLWVNLRRYNPRRIVSGNPARDCPAPANEYQFLRVGDAIEITVTGMIRTDPTAALGGREGIPFGGVRDLDATTPNPKLTCSLTQLVHPDKQLYRYYLTSDGRLINTQLNEPLVGGVTKGGNIAESPVTHFRSLWSREPTGGTLQSPSLSNIKGIAISPNNDRAYVLKPGEIWIYTSCTDRTVTVGGEQFRGIPDCTTGTPLKLNYLPYTIQDIAVDFNDTNGTETAYTHQNDILYAIRNTGPASGAEQLLKYTVPLAMPAAPGGLFANTTDYVLLSNSRIKSIFAVPSFPLASPRVPPALYFSNTDCYGGPGASVDVATPFCVTIHNAGDQEFAMPLGDALVQAIDFSN